MKTLDRRHLLPCLPRSDGRLDPRHRATRDQSGRGGGTLRVASDVLQRYRAGRTECFLAEHREGCKVVENEPAGIVWPSLRNSAQRADGRAVWKIEFRFTARQTSRCD